MGNTISLICYQIDKPEFKQLTMRAYQETITLSTFRNLFLWSSWNFPQIWFCTLICTTEIRESHDNFWKLPIYMLVEFEFLVKQDVITHAAMLKPVKSRIVGVIIVIWLINIHKLIHLKYLTVWSTIKSIAFFHQVGTPKHCDSNH